MRVDKWLNVPATLEEFERGFESRPFTETVTICFDSGMRIPSIEEFSTLWMLAADLFASTCMRRKQESPSPSFLTHVPNTPTAQAVHR